MKWAFFPLLWVMVTAGRDWCCCLDLSKGGPYRPSEKVLETPWKGSGVSQDSVDHTWSTTRCVYKQKPLPCLRKSTLILQWHPTCMWSILKLTLIFKTPLCIFFLVTVWIQLKFTHWIWLVCLLTNLEQFSLPGSHRLYEESRPAVVWSVLDLSDLPSWWDSGQTLYRWWGTPPTAFYQEDRMSDCPIISGS